MQRSYRIAAAAIGAVLAAGATPALAQSTTLNEMRREQGNPGQSWVPAQNRAAAEADAMGRQDAMRWLTEADQALRRGRTGQAMELLERAETRMLSRSIPVTMAGQPMQDAVVDNLAAARRALASRDRDGAMRGIAAAQAGFGAMPHDDMASGAGGSMLPSEGGGSRMMLRDGGTGSSSMSRASVDLAAPRSGRPAAGPRFAQGAGGGGGGMGEGSGGLQGSTPGSPGTGMGGSTPSPRAETPLQPGQTSALPGANVPGGAGSAPGAGAPGAPSPGSGGVGIGTTPDGRTVTPTTPGQRPVR